MCPDCGSTTYWKDGVRYTEWGNVQRYVCRDCGYRFSETCLNHFDGLEPIKNIHWQSLNMPLSLPFNRQIGVSQPKAAKNLVKVETKTKVRTSPLAEKLVNYILYLKRIGRKDSTIETYHDYIRILSKSNLDDPDEIALFIHDHFKENSSRISAVYAYDAYLKSLGKTWDRPKYIAESKLPFIPTDEMLKNTLMTGRKTSIAFTKILYETGCRTNEAERVEWEDIDYARKRIYIRASKKGKARFIPISDDLINLLSRQPRTDEVNVFEKRSKDARRACFSKRMKRLARLTQDRKYLKIHLHTFRHCFALRTYHRTKDILHLKMLMGHKSLLTTQRYVEIYCQLYDSGKPTQFITKIATTKKERCSLINEGWEFIKNDGDDWYFRKPK
ncbi:MAG: tyrosine-type recombinase/integrase [Candidatus Bathyarchaeum tardum]|nr:MAG: tyrosine-type recombinase/integrase [Candidatus Bathyarchaeum tardum]